MRLYFLLFSLLPLLSGCEPKPFARLKFLDVEYSDMKYAIAFSSDIDFDKVYSKAKGDMLVTRRLICALGDEQDFSVEHVMRRSFSGNFEPLPRSSKTGSLGVSYVSQGYFEEAIRDGSSSEIIRPEEVNELLRGKPSIPCKVVMTIFLSQPYYSEIMQIPSEAIIKSSQRHTN